MSNGEHTVGLASTKSLEKRSKTNHLTNQLQMLKNPLFDREAKNFKIKNNLSSTKREIEQDKTDQKTTKSDAEKLLKNSNQAYAGVINNNIQGLSINYSNHIMPPLTS